MVYLFLLHLSANIKKKRLRDSFATDQRKVDEREKSQYFLKNSPEDTIRKLCDIVWAYRPNLLLSLPRGSLPLSNTAKAERRLGNHTPKTRSGGSSLAPKNRLSFPYAPLLVQSLD